MVGTGVPDATGGDHPAGQRPRRRKAPPGLRVLERDGFWHVSGTVRGGGRKAHVGRSTGLPARPDTRDNAETERRWLEAAAIDNLLHGTKASKTVTFAAHQYLTAPRERPLGKATADIIKAIEAKFGPGILREIGEDEWFAWVDHRSAGNKSETRERLLNAVGGIPQLERPAEAGLAAPTIRDAAEILKLRAPPDL
jgi:hypothetical protein